MHKGLLKIRSLFDILKSQTILFSYLLLLLLIISPVLASDKANMNLNIDSETAKKLAVDRYNNLFSEKFYYNFGDKKYYQFPKLDAKFFEHAEKKSTHWNVSHNPPAGISININVDLYGKWVEILNVDFSSE